MKFRFLLLSLILLLGGFGCAKKEAVDFSKINWQLEHIFNAEYGFEYKLYYPEGWRIDQSDDHSVVIATTAGVNESDSSFTVTTLATNPSAKDAAAIESDTMQSLEKKFPVSKIVESEKIINGRKWLVLELYDVMISARGAGEKKNPNADLVPGNGFYYFTDNPPYVTRIAFNVADKEKNQLLPFFLEMLKRFLLIPAVGPKQ